MGLLFVGQLGSLVQIVHVCMTVSCTGPDVLQHISCMAMEGDAVWAASGPNVIKYIRGKEVSLPASSS